MMKTGYATFSAWKGLLLLFPVLFVSLVISCSGGSQHTGDEKRSGKPEGTASRDPSPKQKVTRISAPEENTTCRIGDRITLSLEIEDPGFRIDSFQVFIDGRLIGTGSGETLEFVWNTAGSKTGKRIIKTLTCGTGNLREQNTVSVILLSDITPRQYGYRVIHEYPHDIRAYTQGLVYEDGILYESTGQRGESTLRKVRLETGDLIESLNLPPNLFGEGACILGDKIIQITWTSRVGFVYDKETFRLLNRLEYPTQGWGLTTNGEQLIMSDGSNIIYFLEPEYFTELSRIEVFDHERSVNNLNELEYIDGSIYANVYQTDLIAVIDPLTGKVLAWIDLHGLLSPKDRHDRIDVLNGIAFDPENRRLFVTGKRWPKVFEIQLVPR